MNYLLLWLIATGWSALFPTKEPAKTTPKPVVVLELFTSQGCSSCPPADKALQAITSQAARSGQLVYGLSFHVDYWNRLGWQDPFSDRQYTERQRQYNRSLKTQTYTPQLIINGQQDVIGGQRGRIDQAIQIIQQQPASAFIDVKGSMTQDAKQVHVHYAISTAGPHRVNIALVQKEARTAVRNGENGGRRLVNVNVVRQFKTVEEADTSGSISLDLPTGFTADQTAVLVYVQRTDSGQIVGAKML